MDGRPTQFNLIKHRGDPRTALTHSGHTVTKQAYLYFKDQEGKFQYVKAADYHNEHFLYVDPLYNTDEGMGHWFAMCTCGSIAVLIGEGVSAGIFQSGGEQMVVCQAHTASLLNTGIGRHQGQDTTRWD